MMHKLTIGLTLLLLVVAPSELPAQEGSDDAFFESRIRPLLIERCIACHGEKSREGNLRLDSRLGWQVGGDRGPAITPSDIDRSLLIDAVSYTNADLQMPPTKKLSDREIADLKQWIASGAHDPRDKVEPLKQTTDQPLWSVAPLSQPSLPELVDNQWSQQPIDRFVLERLKTAELQPSPRADPRTLIRRITFDLIGLPPTTEEVAQFETDYAIDPAGTYRGAVDRLLTSPHYGEQWARHWLDLARYSDTKGYVYAREEKRWIHATAYRDWVVRAFNEDLPYDKFVRLQVAADQIVAPDSPDLAAMGFLTLGRRFLGVTHDIIDDRIDVVTRGILGLTVACARCHDHKYDAIPTRDYYSLYGVFQSCSEEVVQCGTSSDAAFTEELTKRQAALRGAMTKRREELSGRIRSRLADYLLAQLELEKYPEEVFNQIIEPDDIAPFVVRRWQAFLAKDKLSPAPIFARWHELVESGTPEESRQAAADYGTQFAAINKQWQELLQSNPQATELPDAEGETLRKFLYAVDSPCHVPDEHIANIEMYFPTNIITELWKFQGELDRLVMDNPNAPVHSTVLVDRPIAITPRVFARGNPLNKGAEVPRRFLQLLGGSDDQPFRTGSGRLELAHALTDPANPLTPRVMVNRIWMHHFGTGLVNSPSDFGLRAEIPTHAELLDWLAQKFIDSGWSMKELHRLILLSETYQQSSFGPSDFDAFTKAERIDPANRLLWRHTAHRLTFEEARDAWLASTGELNLQLGGRPEPLFGSSSFRRSIYAFIDRENVSPVLRMFDFANPDLSIPQRSETTVPQQALFAMNHPFIADRARKIQSNNAELSPAERLERIYQRLYQRAPTVEERNHALTFLQAENDRELSDKKPNAWTYGYGEFDHQTGKLKSFTALPRFVGSAWQGGDNFPDGPLGWLQLTATGGHPGNDLQHAVVRRWTAPADGRYRISSTVVHEPEPGDGVRAFVSHNRAGLLKSATVHQSSEPLSIDAIALSKGDTIDFIVDIKGVLNSDQFLWSPQILMIDAAQTEFTANSAANVASVRWDAAEDFAGQSLTTLDRWEQLTQILMLANEFMFID